MTATTGGCDYLGPDRRREEHPVDRERRQVAVPHVRTRGGRLLLRLAVALVAALALPALAAQVLEDSTIESIRTGVASVGTALFVSASFSYLLRWRLTGEAPVALVGVGLLVYGSVTGFFLPLATAITGDSASPLGAGGMVRALNSVVVMSLLVRSLSTPVIDSRLRPLRLFALAAGGLTAVFLLLGLATAQGSASPVPTAPVVPLYVALAVGWGSAAALLVRRAANRLQGDVLWLGLALGCLALGNLLRATPMGPHAAGVLSAATVSAVAAAVALYGSARHLTELLGSLGSERLRLRGALISHQQELESQRAGREERLHDVRSTLAAIRCAAGTLHRYDEKLASTQRQSLQRAVSSELVRLERLIDPAESSAARPFDLADALTPVVETERAMGSEITAELGSLQAIGCPEDTAAIVQNLLVNARRYAPGTPVSITAEVGGGVVEVRVKDGGPGLSDAESGEVFARGRRGSASRQAEGSGLGLFVSRRLAAEQGGELFALPGQRDGACFVLRLPSPPVSDQGSRPGTLADVG